MRALRPVSRRSFLATVVGAAAATSLFSDAAHAQSGCSDHDPSDPAGNGRSCNGCTDTDSSDSTGFGRHCPPPPRSGCSDRDPGDPPGNGVTCRPCSDHDKGPRADPIGQGRYCRR